MKNGIELIAQERKRQIELDGYTSLNDKEYQEGELANAAAYYALTDELIDFINQNWGNDMHLHIWPFDLNSIKRTPEDRIRELQKAGALIAAEIDRINNIKP
jgi:hypothetical protein